MIPISKPDIGPDEERAVLDVLRSGMLAMGNGRPSSRRPGRPIAASATPCS